MKKSVDKIATQRKGSRIYKQCKSLEYCCYHFIDEEIKSPKTRVSERFSDITKKRVAEPGFEPRYFWL